MIEKNDFLDDSSIYNYFLDIVCEYNSDKIKNKTSNLLEKISQSKENYNILLEFLLFITYIFNIENINDFEKKKCFIILYEFYKYFSEIAFFYLLNMNISYLPISLIEYFLVNSGVNNKIDMFKIEINMHEFFIKNINNRINYDRKQLFFLDDKVLKNIYDNKEFDKKSFKIILLNNIKENDFNTLNQIKKIIVNEFINTDFEIFNCFDYKL